MPSQTKSTAEQVFFYGMNDTAPDLEYVLRDRDGNPINAEGWDVYITIGWTTYSHTWSPASRVIVNRAPCTVDADQVANTGKVYWTPQKGDLEHPGTFDFSFEMVKGTQVRTVKTLAYDHINVQTPPGGRREPIV
jgi:hypothetical protein